MRRYILGGLFGVVLGIGCGLSATQVAQTAADESVTAAVIAKCQEEGRAADAGTNLHTYNQCMRTAGLEDGGDQ